MPSFIVPCTNLRMVILFDTVTDFDTTPPELVGCPDDITVQAPLEEPSVSVLWTEPTAIDNSGSMPQVAQTHRPGQHFPIGVTTVTYSFSDDFGNFVTCSFTITGNIKLKMLHTAKCMKFFTGYISSRCC